MMNVKNMKNKLIVIAILSVSFVSLIRGTLNPGMALLYQHYNQYPPSIISLVTTLPSLAVIPVSFIFGKITGIKIKYKTAVILMNCFLLIGGVGPYFFDQIYFLLIMRFIFGIGVGIAITVHKPLILEFFEEDQQKKYLGYTTIIGSAGMIFFQTLVGWFSQYSWNDMFLSYLPLILTLILSFFLADIELKSVKVKKKESLKLNIKFFVLIFIYLLMNMVATSFGINQSVLFLLKGFTNTAVFTASCSNIQALFSMISGFMFGKLEKRYQNQLLYMSLIFCAISVFVIGISHEDIIIIIMMSIFGFFYNIVVLYIFIILANLVTDEQKAVAGGYMGTAAGIGGFFATGLLELCDRIFHESIYSIVGMFVVLFILLYFLIKRIFYEDI